MNVARNKHYQIKIIALLAIMILHRLSMAQCCSPGNPSSGNQLVGSNGKGALRFLTSYQFAYSDTYYQGKSPSIGSYENANYQYIGLNIDYGLTTSTLTYLESGYFFSRRRNNSNPEFSNNAPGATNGIIGLRQIAIPFSAKGLGLEAGFGLKYPYSLEPISRNEYPLASELQPSTNAFGIVADAATQWGMLNYGLRFIGYLRYELNFRNRRHYSYGNLISPVVMGIWSHWGWNIGQQFQWEWHLPDKQDDRIQLETGSHLIWWQNEIGYEITPSFRLTATGAIPIYRDYRGTQLAAEYNTQIRVLFLIPSDIFKIY